MDGEGEQRAYRCPTKRNTDGSISGGSVCIFLANEILGDIKQSDIHKTQAGRQTDDAHVEPRAVQTWHGESVKSLQEDEPDAAGLGMSADVNAFIQT